MAQPSPWSHPPFEVKSHRESQAEVAEVLAELETFVINHNFGLSAIELAIELTLEPEIGPETHYRIARLKNAQAVYQLAKTLRQIDEMHLAQAIKTLNQASLKTPAGFEAFIDKYEFSEEAEALIKRVCDECDAGTLTFVGKEANARIEQLRKSGMTEAADKKGRAGVVEVGQKGKDILQSPPIKIPLNPETIGNTSADFRFHLAQALQASSVESGFMVIFKNKAEIEAFEAQMKARMKQMLGVEQQA